MRARAGRGRRREIRADVRREQDDRVREVDRAPAAVREATLVEHAEEALEHVAVGLLDLVEEDDLVRTTAHRLGELPARLVADVAGRRADEPRDGVRLGVLGEIEPRHRVGRVEEALGDRLRGLRLADAGGAEQEERADRTPRTEARTRCGAARARSARARSCDRRCDCRAAPRGAAGARRRSRAGALPERRRARSPPRRRARTRRAARRDAARVRRRDRGSARPCRAAPCSAGSERST